MLILLVGTGILMTVLTRIFQISHFSHWVKNTIGGIFKDKHVTAHTGKDDTQISQFQSLCTALAATIGTGNIAGVAAAILSGGPGAIFWMWIVAFFGMMTNFSENVLGIYYRRRNEKNEWSGGAMYYLKYGLGSKKGCQFIGTALALMFSVFCILASFGIDNMSQINSIAVNMNSAFGVPHFGTGFILMLGVMMVAAPGVPGGAIMAALGVLQSILGFTAEQQAVMIALYITMDSFGTACNVTGDGAIALVVDRIYNRKKPQKSV